MSNMELRRKVGYKSRRRRAPRRPTPHSDRRSHAAFLALPRDEWDGCWEMDTVEGRGVSFDQLAPADCALLMSRASPEPRGSLAFMRPSRMLLAAYGDDARVLMDAYGIELLDPPRARPHPGLHRAHQGREGRRASGRVGAGKPNRFRGSPLR